VTIGNGDGGRGGGGRLIQRPMVMNTEAQPAKSNEQREFDDEDDEEIDHRRKRKRKRLPLAPGINGKDNIDE
jgi:hypothetical protein